MLQNLFFDLNGIKLEINNIKIKGKSLITWKLTTHIDVSNPKTKD